MDPASSSSVAQGLMAVNPRQGAFYVARAAHVRRLEELEQEEGEAAAIAVDTAAATDDAFHDDEVLGEQGAFDPEHVAREIRLVNNAVPPKEDVYDAARRALRR
jgi:hypothetical protein